MYRVVFSPECRTELHELNAYLTRNGSRRIAEAYMHDLRRSVSSSDHHRIADSIAMA